MKKKSFTLVELLIVIVIIGILATFVILSLNGTTKSARDAKAKRSLETVRDAVAQYVAANYNVSLNGVFGDSATSITATNVADSINMKLRSGGATAFSTTPTDAKGDPVKIDFNAYGYRLEAKTASYDGSTDKTCWYVYMQNYKLGNTALKDNLTLKQSTTDCTLY